MFNVIKKITECLIQIYSNPLDAKNSLLVYFFLDLKYLKLYLRFIFNVL